MKQIRVLVVEDHPIVREGLKMLLASAGDVVVVGDVDSGDAAVVAVASRPVDVVLLDLDLGGDDGLKAVPRIAECAPGTKVLVLTALRDAERHRASLLAGARGVVTKDKAGDVILKAIRKVETGELWFERQLLEAAVTRTLSRESGNPPPVDALTEREHEIVQLIGEGLKNSEIAKRLFISEKTVRNHLTSIFDKLGVSDRLELLVHAHQLGIVSIPRRAAL